MVEDTDKLRLARYHSDLNGFHQVDDLYIGYGIIGIVLSRMLLKSRWVKRGWAVTIATVPKTLKLQ